MSEPEPLVTTRLRLEPTRARHGDAMWTAIQRSLPELSRWMIWAVDPLKEQTLAFAAGAEREWAAKQAWHFTIVHEETVAGHISLLRSNLLAGYSELGYWIRSDVAGQGFATEAGLAVIDYGFAVVGLHRIELQAAVTNRASLRVAAKLGFQSEGICRDRTRTRGGWVDTELFGLLADDPH